MLLQTSQNKEYLEELAYETAILYAAEQPGEDYHPEYKENKKTFTKLITTSAKMERYLKKYFKELATRIKPKIDWGYYYQNVKKGSVFYEDIPFESEVLQLQVAFQDTLDDIFGLGGMAGLQDLNLRSDFSQTDAASIKALNKYTLTLARGITDTTADRIKASIMRSMALGETEDEATDRLTDIIDDPKRAAMIAHTETVRAYSMGKMEVGNRVGAQYKVWRDGQPRACTVCTKLHGMVVPLNSEFPSVTGGTINMAPAHPWCKCLTKLVLDKSFLQEDEAIYEGKEKGKKKSGVIWITKGGRSFPINVSKSKGAGKANGKVGKGNSGFGYNVAKIEGTSFKRSSNLISREGSPDRGRVDSYKKLIKSGHHVSPLLVVEEKGNKWGIEDGKHRFQAFKELHYKFIPTVTKHTPQYDKATEADNAAIAKLK